MALITHAVTRRTSPATTTSTTFQTSLNLDSSNFTAGHTYLIIASGILRSSTAGACEKRIIHGSTSFSGTVRRTTQTRQNWPYFAWTVWEAVEGEAVTLQYRSTVISGPTATTDNAVLLAIDLDDLTTDDWKVLENIPGDSMTTTYTTSNNPAITFTPSESGDWLVLGYQRFTGTNNIDSFQSRMHKTGGTETFLPEAIVEGNADTGLDLLHTMGRVFALTASTEYTFEMQGARHNGSGGTRSQGGIFALRLDAFRGYDFVWDESNVNLGTSTFGTEVVTVSHEPPSSTTALVIGGWQWDVENSARDTWSRLQVDDTDHPDTQTSDAYQINVSDSRDEVPIYHADIVDIEAAANVAAIDSYSDSTTNTPHAQQRSLLILDLEIGQGVSATPGAGSAVFTGHAPVADSGKVVEDTISLQETLTKQVSRLEEESVQLDEDLEGVAESGDPSTALQATVVSTPRDLTGSGSTTYVDIEDGSVLLRRNTSYLVVVTLQEKINPETAGLLYGVRVKIGSTVIDESEQLNRFAGSNPVDFYTYSWADIVTISGSSVTLSVQGKVTNASNILTIDQIVLTAIPLTGLTTETDYWEVERANDDSLTTSNTDGASKTFSPATDDNWLIFSSSQVEATSTTVHQYSDLVISGAISRTLRSRMAFKDVGEKRLHELRTVIVGTGASVTITEKSGSITSNAHTRLHSKLIGIRLNAFENYAFSLTTGSTSLDLNTPYATLAQTLTSTAPSVKRAVILGFALKSSNSTGHAMEARLQLEDIDAVPTTTDDQYRFHFSTHFNDVLSINLSAVTTVPTGEFTIDFDASAEASAPPVVVNVTHRLLVVILFEDALAETLILQEKLTRQVIKGLGETVDLSEPGAELSQPLVVVVSEVRAITARGNNHRVFVSQDNGQSWRLRYLLVSERGATESRILVKNSRSFFIGDTVYPAPGWYPEAGVSVIDLEAFPVWLTRWTAEQINSVPNLNVSPWRIYDFANLGSNHYVAVGERILGAFQLIHSFNAGDSWQDPVEVEGAGGRALASLAVGPNLLVGGVHKAQGNSVVSISNDGGLTFSEIELLAMSGLDVETITAIGGSSVVLIGGGLLTGVGFERQPKLFRSTDSGQTYTDVTSGIASLGQAQAVTCIVDAGDGNVALALSGSPTNGHLYFRVSNDSGLTFPVVGSYDPAPVGLDSAGVRWPQARSGVLAEDGSIIFGISRGTISAVVEMWRGVIGIGVAEWKLTDSFFHTQFSGSFMEASLVKLDDPAPVEFPEPPVQINCPDFFDFKFKFTITSPRQGKEWFEKEILFPLGMYPVILSDGRLSIRRFKKRI